MLTAVNACLRLVAALGMVALAACAARRSAADDLPLRVVTYNIAAGYGNLDRVAQRIAELNADLVALQEVDVEWHERSGFADQARELSRKLGMQVRFAPIYSLRATSEGRGAREFGVALLSRWPIESWSNDSITRLSTQDANAQPARMPGLLRATVNVQGRRLQVLSTHLDYRQNPSVRRAQVADMLALIGNEAGPVMLAGDLNATPDAGELQPLFRRLRDAWPDSAGAGYTYPANEPQKRIDYVLVSSHFRVRRAFVAPDPTASDHRPVIADLLLRR